MSLELTHDLGELADHLLVLRGSDELLPGEAPGAVVVDNGEDLADLLSADACPSLPRDVNAVLHEELEDLPDVEGAYRSGLAQPYLSRPRQMC